MTDDKRLGPLVLSDRRNFRMYFGCAPVPYGRLEVFDSKSGEPLTLYADPNGEIPHPRPLFMDAEGAATVFLECGLTVEARCYDAFGSILSIQKGVSTCPTTT